MGDGRNGYGEVPLVGTGARGVPNSDQSVSGGGKVESFMQSAAQTGTVKAGFVIGIGKQVYDRSHFVHGTGQFPGGG
ncbi:hypothetical protein AA100600_2727 [Gluconobacter thailandicus F149-1 = NBRC 100600]|nr:hypothetical protein AA100600_2727 [Gluconobacter thailandicus F149-1 = NBRC 100600]